eukprot:Gb_09804 [translate_table: standard]
MMEKETRHVEWARLRVAGRPLMTGIAVGETPLLWVACRASPRLVHVYCDSHLKVLWRFPSDPIFVHLEKSRGNWSHKGCMTSNEANFDDNAPSLLVITSDGHVWLLPVFPINRATERPSKRKKVSYPAEAYKLGPRFTASQTHKTQENSVLKSQLRNDEWGLFEDIDIYESMDCDDDVTILREKDASSDSLIVENSFKNVSLRKQMSTSTSDGVFLQVKQLAISTPPKLIQKTIASLVMQENLIGIVEGACFAVFGPHDMVIVISKCSLQFFQATTSAVSPSILFERVESMDGDLSFHKDPTCALIITAAKNISTDGYGQVATLLHEKLFNVFLEGFNSAKPQHLLLKGDTDGRVYLSPLFCPDIKMPASRILCNLEQPILALFAIPSGNARNKSEFLINDEIENKTARQKLEVRDTLLIVGQYGRIVSISCSNNLDECSCFLSNSWTKYKVLFDINLEKSNFDIRDWKVQTPLTYVCMLGYKHLCYCARSEVFILSLFEDRDVQQSVGMGPGKMTTHGEKHRTGLECQTSMGNNTLDQQQAGCILKEIVLPKKIPIADTIIGIAAKDNSVCNTRGRPLVVLTARGRILGVEVSDYALTLEGYYYGSLPRKTWRTWQSNMDDHVKGLISMIDEISRAANLIQQRNHSLNLALNELAFSLKVASSILLDPNRDILLSPKPTRKKNVSNTPLSPKCTIKVTPLPAMLVSSENLAFENYTSSSEIKSTESFLQNEMCGLARINVTLYNSTEQLISSHWTLMLELHNTGMNNSIVATYSSVINNGFGLLPGAHCIIEFDVKLFGLHVGPIIVFIYLCHVHDYHELLHGHSFTDHRGETSTPLRKHLQGLTCLGNSKIDKEFLATVTHEETQSSSIRASNKSFNTTGSICIPLSRDRIDILSVASHPPQKSLHACRVSCPSDKSSGLNDNVAMPKSCHENVLGAFSGTLNVTLKASEQHSRTTGDALKTWKELFLEDLVEKGSLSKAGDKIILSVPGGQIISISLRGSPVQEESYLLQLHFEAPSLQLGCLLREALTWRLKNCEAIGSIQSRKDALHNFSVVRDLDHISTVDATVLEIKKQAEVILHRTEVLSTIWNEIKLQDAGDSMEFLPLLGDIQSIIYDLLKVYKCSRES